MMRMVSATGCLGGRGGSSQRKREADPGAGTAVRSVEDVEPAAVGLHEPPADEESQAGARDPRLADVPRPVERLRDEIPFRLGDPDTLVIDRDRQPLPV